MPQYQRKDIFIYPVFLCIRSTNPVLQWRDRRGGLIEDQECGGGACPGGLLSSSLTLVPQRADIYLVSGRRNSAASP